MQGPLCCLSEQDLSKQRVHDVHETYLPPDLPDRQEMHTRDLAFARAPCIPMRYTHFKESGVRNHASMLPSMQKLPLAVHELQNGNIYFHDLQNICMNRTTINLCIRACKVWPGNLVMAQDLIRLFKCGLLAWK